MPISKVHARSVYDSRGNPTVEVDIVTETGLHRKYSKAEQLQLSSARQQSS